jgi:hypothetical protein
MTPDALFGFFWGCLLFGFLWLVDRESYKPMPRTWRGLARKLLGK